MTRQGGLIRKTAFLAALSLGATGLGAASALANGGDFFHQLEEMLLEREAETGPSYFGFVRDQRGRAVSDASVAAMIAPSGSGKIVKSDAIGQYKITGFAQQTDPKSVEISCSKPGYRQVAATRRITQRETLMQIETTCVLAAETAAAN